MDLGADIGLIRPAVLYKSRKYDPEEWGEVKIVSGSMIETLWTIQVVLYEEP